MLYIKIQHFKKKHIGQYLEGIGVFKFENFHLLETLYNFSSLFTIYNLNDSNVIYKKCSTFQKKHVGQYSEEIGVFKFEKFFVLVSFFLPI